MLQWTIGTVDSSLDAALLLLLLPAVVAAPQLLTCYHWEVQGFCLLRGRLWRTEVQEGHGAVIQPSLAECKGPE